MIKYKYLLVQNDKELTALLAQMEARGIKDFGHMPYSIGRDGQTGIHPEIMSRYPPEVSIMRYAEPPMKIEITSEVLYDDFTDTWSFDESVWMPKEAHGKKFKIILEEIQ